MAAYSIWIVEYARATEYPISAVLYGRHNEGHRVLPCCYGVLKGEGHLAVVDTGFNYAEFGRVLADTFGFKDWQPPEVVLKRIGIDPAAVDTVILTHNHFDHAGGVENFPRAHVYIQQREVTKFMWARSLPERLQWLTTASDPDLLLALVTALKEGRLTLLEGAAEVLPGVRVIPAYDTHTAGSQYVTIENAHDGPWLMAGDNVYVYDNLLGANGDGRFIPVGLAFGSMERCMLTMDEMVQSVGGEVTRVLPFHDFHLWEQFPSRTFEDGLHVAEISLAPAEPSRIERAAVAR